MRIPILRKKKPSNKLPGVGVPYMGTLNNSKFEAWAWVIKKAFEIDDCLESFSIPQSRLLEIVGELREKDQLPALFYSPLCPTIDDIEKMSDIGLDIKDYGEKRVLVLQPESRLANLILKH